MIVHFKILSFGLEPAQEWTPIGVGGVDEDELSVLKMLQNFHPNISLIKEMRLLTNQSIEKAFSELTG